MACIEKFPRPPPAIGGLSPVIAEVSCSPVLIDSFHKRWFLITALIAAAALGFYLWLYTATPGGLTGGSTVGLWYGIAGSLLMVYAGLLSGLRKVPSWWWIGARKTWLRGHLWLGTLSLVFILCHSGFHWGGPLELALWIVFLLTLATGFFGLLLQQFMPRWLTTRLEREAPYEQIPHICQVLRRRADELAGKIMGAQMEGTQTNIFSSQVGIGAKLQFQKFYSRHVRPFLLEGDIRSALLANALEAEQAFKRLRALPGLADDEDELVQLQSLCDERRDLPEQEHLHHWLHAWLMLHIPLSVALLVLGVAHVVAALYY